MCILAVKEQIVCRKSNSSPSYHRLFGIFVVGIPTDAHNHSVNVPISHTCPAIIDSCVYICGKIIHHRVWEIGC